jgi:hypothetical protein
MKWKYDHKKLQKKGFSLMLDSSDYIMMVVTAVGINQIIRSQKQAPGMPEKSERKNQDGFGNV